MSANGNGNGAQVECTECNPPRRFKNGAGLNGHMRFKHGLMPTNQAVLPNGKQSQMYQDLQDSVNQLIDQQDELLELARNGNGNGNDQGNGNGNGQRVTIGSGRNGNGNGNGNGQGARDRNGNGNGNGYSTDEIGVISPARDEPDAPTYHCEDCDENGLTPGQPNCDGCGGQLDWNGKVAPGELPVQMPRL